MSFCTVGACIGSNMPAGSVKKLLTDGHLNYNRKATEFAFQEAVNLDTMAVVHLAMCPCK
jgi:hypothetical protein